MFFSGGLAPGGGPRGAVEGATAGDATGPATTPGDDPPATARGRRSRGGRRGRRPRSRRPHLRPAAGSPPPSARPTPRPPPPAGSPPPPPSCCAAPPPPPSRTGSPRRRSSSRARRTRCSGWTRPTPPPARSPRRAAPVRVLWYGGGHDGGAPDQRVRDAIGDWFDHWLAGRDGDGPRHGRSATPSPAACARTATRPTSRTVEAPAYPGLPGAAAVVHHPAPAGGRAAGRAGPRGRQPGRDHLAARARRRAGQRRQPGRRVHRGAAGAVRAVPHRARRRPAARGRRAAGGPHGLPGARPARRRTRPCCSARLYEVTADGTRTLLGGAVAPFRVPVPADGSPARVAVTLPGVVAPIEAGNRLLVSIGTTDQGYAGATSPAVWRIGLAGDGAGSGARSPCRSCPARPSPRTRCPAVRCSASRACSARPCSPGWRPGCAAAGSPAAADARRRPRTAAAAPARSRSATSPRPTAAGSRAVRGVSFDVERGHGARPARPERRRARPPCCACSWA